MVSIFLYATVSALPQETPASPSFHGTLRPELGSNGNSTAVAGISHLRLPSELPLIYCDGAKYRNNLRWGSCLDAIKTIPKSSALRTFQRRGPGRTPDVALPWRFISCLYPRAIRLISTGPDGETADGDCIIDVILKYPNTLTHASYEDLSQAAHGLHRKCVHSHIGGL